MAIYPFPPPDFSCSSSPPFSPNPSLSTRKHPSSSSATHQQHTAWHHQPPAKTHKGTNSIKSGACAPARCSASLPAHTTLLLLLLDSQDRFTHNRHHVRTSHQGRLRRPGHPALFLSAQGDQAQAGKLQRQWRHEHPRPGLVASSPAAPGVPADD